MNVWLLYLLLSLPMTTSQQPTPPRFQKILRFNVYTFVVKSEMSDSGSTATVAAYRGGLLLTRLVQPVGGALLGADVGDLDENRLPELYLYAAGQTDTTYGRVYGWQFLPERLATISLTIPSAPAPAFRGNDRFTLTKNSLCHLVPIYKGGQQTNMAQRVCYRLRPLRENYQLLAD
ncbi:hypothetical protein [Spirosoma rhododendri]|uniref:Uncharacterized protein n=1 Tax=Spirosoma rhododendri TaxID=2728024 RepID=A0A7L5DLN5_9BACT|nr:hypothetical protein [Spirosoma rhododendri]QJD79384.1 hypothetical protein HH216_13905 [Spirosoma rhododendri]